jgi:hypothetical protein
LTDNTPETSSGSEVPIPTIKIPMTKAGSLSHNPILSAELVKYLAAVNNNVNAPMKISRLRSILESFVKSWEVIFFNSLCSEIFYLSSH